MRYAGQGQPLFVPLRQPLARTMAAAHQRLFGFVPEDRALELIEIRARAETTSRALPIRRRAERPVPPPQPREQRRPPAGGPAWPVFRRTNLHVGHKVKGPSVIEEFTGATLVPVGWRCRVEPFGLVLEMA